MKVNLSELDKTVPLQDILNYMLDNKYTVVVNDYPPLPHIEYSIDDLFTVWERIRQVWKAKN